MTIAAQFLFENPCRPRHFKPPPCAAIIREGPAKEALEGWRSFGEVPVVVAIQTGARQVDFDPFAYATSRVQLIAQGLA